MSSGLPKRTMTDPYIPPWNFSYTYFNNFLPPFLLNSISCNTITPLKFTWLVPQMPCTSSVSGILAGQILSENFSPSLSELYSKVPAYLATRLGQLPHRMVCHLDLFACLPSRQFSSFSLLLISFDLEVVSGGLVGSTSYQEHMPRDSVCFVLPHTNEPVASL